MAYRSDVTVKQLLSGSIEPPEWSDSLIKTLESCTGMPGNRAWINDGNNDFSSSYAFGGGVASPGNEVVPSSKSGKKKKAPNASFPPPDWGQQKNSGSYFESEFPSDFGSARAPKPWNGYRKTDTFSATTFGTHFESDFSPDEPQTRPNPYTGHSHHQVSGIVDDPFAPDSPFDSLPRPNHTESHPSPKSTGHFRSISAASPFSQTTSSSRNPFAPGGAGSLVASHQRSFSLAQPPYIASKPEFTVPLSPQDGIARAIALYNFEAVEVCVLPRLYIARKRSVDHINTSFG
jgi:hypothetical protein